MFRKILVPIDVAETAIAQPAIAAALEQARLSNGAIRLINVQSLLPATFMDYVPADFDAAQKTKAEESLAKVAASFSDLAGQSLRLARVDRRVVFHWAALRFARARSRRRAKARRT